MKTFRDIPITLRIEILKELPRGTPLTYHNPASRYDRDQVLKMGDRNHLMMVLLDGSLAPLHYKNLSCPEFDKVIAVSNRLHNEQK